MKTKLFTRNNAPQSEDVFVTDLPARAFFNMKTQCIFLGKENAEIKPAEIKLFSENCVLTFILCD